MSYQVLARKWRPAKFQEMVGQEHVLKALVNALDDDRLHHAYLFTGTRGVGKTSIARLFAKSLNCETGVSSTPCGECSACREIAEGRFVDLIEVDAASRTKVEDTRELMENVQYAPTHGRYKVYLIDEVHMLSTHSFNALLKTLEEPPPHVKFLLATTDPQKLPITILSRCLQFNLKNLIPERIVNHLTHVLTQEQVAYDDPALWLLARSADGSMRDAMSLTDQAIAFGAGSIQEADVRAMLGTIDQRLVYQMLQCLASGDARGLIASVSDLAQFSPDYNAVLGDLISVLHRIALAQTIPDAVDNSMGDKEQVTQLAGQLSAEDVQLYYQVALMGRKDLPFVPDPREGLEMVLLRMLAFRPASAAPRNVTLSGVEQSSVTPQSQASSEAPSSVVATSEPQQVHSVPSQAQPSDSKPPLSESEAYPELTGPEVDPVKKPEVKAAEADLPPPWDTHDGEDPGYSSADLIPAAGGENSDVFAKEPEMVPEKAPLTDLSEVGEIAKSVVEVESCPNTLADLVLEHWVHISRSIGLSGMTESLATHLSLENISESGLVFHYTKEQHTMLNEIQRERISDALNSYFQTTLQIEFMQSPQRQETPAQYLNRKREERHALAIETIRNDATVKLLQDNFDAQIELSSVVPID